MTGACIKTNTGEKKRSLRDFLKPVENELWEHHFGTRSADRTHSKGKRKPITASSGRPTALSSGAACGENFETVVAETVIPLRAKPTSSTAIPWPRGSGTVGQLLEFARDAEVFRDADDAAYATLPVSGRTVRVRSQAFRDWLTARFWLTGEQRPSKPQMRDALDDIDTWVRMAGEVRPVGRRVAEVEGCLYLDLGGADGRAVEIDAEGWRIVGSAPVNFVRAPGMGALPEPVRGGSIESLRAYVLATDDSFLTAVAWLLSTLRPNGPYPLLYLTGAQGSAKSTTATFLKTLIDPHEAMLRGLPSTEEDLFVGSLSGQVLAFDNISRISDAMSDALCRLATGATFTTRRRFTDTDEVRITAARPMLLTGIVDATGRPDLADRLFRLELQRIPDGQRVSERALHASFETDRPMLLGALLDLAVEGLRASGEPRLQSGMRMIDAVEWSQACLGRLATEEKLIETLRSSQDLVVADLIALNPVAQAILKIVHQRGEWRGTATQLLVEVRRLTPREEHNVPRGSAQLSAEIHRLATDLRKIGVEIESRRAGRRGERLILISASEEDPRTADGAGI